jgi:CRISPR system Cascade subunit CasE
MMVLSRATLRADSSVRALAPLLLPATGAERLLAGHRLVWSLMSDAPGRARDFLWREEAPGKFLILAPRAAVADGSLFDVESKPWAPALRPGDRLGFVLRAHATVARGDASGRRGRRRDVVMDALFDVPKADRAARRPGVVTEAGTRWLAAQGSRAAFSIAAPEVRVDGYDVARIARPDSAPIELATLEFDGALTVDNPARFVAAVVSGFGRARAFGRGLMLLRRLSAS